MATRSTIGIEFENGTVNYVYCHSDGYIEHNGELLLRQYNTTEKVRKLVNLGHLSFLDERLDPVEGLAPGHNQLEKVNGEYKWIKGKPVRHSFDTPQAGVTIAYHRDRGDQYHINRVSTSRKAIEPQEYNYLFVIKEQKWYVARETGDKVGDWIELEPEVQRELKYQQEQQEMYQRVEKLKKNKI